MYILCEDKRRAAAIQKLKFNLKAKVFPQSIYFAVKNKVLHIIAMQSRSCVARTQYCLDPQVVFPSENIAFTAHTLELVKLNLIVNFVLYIYRSQELEKKTLKTNIVFYYVGIVR